MDSNDFIILTGRLERESDDNPQLHRLKVALVAGLGFAPLLLFGIVFLISLIAVIQGVVAEGHPSALALVTAIVCIVMLGVLVQSLAIELGAPAGREVTSEEAPALFAAIDDVIERTAVTIKDKVRPVTIDSVVLDGSFEVRLHQLPDWGVFGRYHNHLQIGVPLLAALNIAELKALLAHELGHLGRAHERFEAWIYRQRVVWRALQDKYDHPVSTIDRVLAKFYAPYALYFHAYSFVLARKLEYSADRVAAKATHPGALANALTKIALMGRYLEEVYWPRFMAQVEQSPEPPYMPFAMLPRAFGLGQKQWSRQDWLDRSLRTFPTEGDTHPSLGERFAALNILPAPPSYAPDRSALSLFGRNSQDTLKWCDDEWRRENGPAWRKRHRDIKEIRWKIEEYERAQAVAELKADDLWQKVLLILDLGEYERAIEELQFLVAREPTMAKAHLLLGKLLLQHGNEIGLESLALAAKHDQQMVEDAAGAGYNYLLDRGRKPEAQRFWDRVCAA